MTDALEQTMASYDFREAHTRDIEAPPTAVWDALFAVRLDQMRISRPLVALRNFGGSPTPDGSLLEHGPVTIYLREEPTYVAGGFVGRPWRRSSPRLPIASLAELGAFAEPGWAKVLTDFRITPIDGGSRLRTETRIACTDDGARRRFSLYWALIRPGSGLIRRDLLATVDRLATRGGR